MYEPARTDWQSSRRYSTICWQCQTHIQLIRQWHKYTEYKLKANTFWKPPWTRYFLESLCSTQTIDEHKPNSGTHHAYYKISDRRSENTMPKKYQTDAQRTQCPTNMKQEWNKLLTKERWLTTHVYASHRWTQTTNKGILTHNTCVRTHINEHKLLTKEHWLTTRVRTHINERRLLTKAHWLTTHVYALASMNTNY